MFRTIFAKFQYMLYYCRPIRKLCKKTLLKEWKKTVKNRPIIAIISIISGDSCLKNIVHNILLHETFRMMGHLILSNNVKFIKIGFE